MKVRGWRLLAAALTLAPMAVATPVFAWNIICGVSILKTAGDNTRKWEADSQALYGISAYFQGVAELQRVDLAMDGTFSNPKSNVNPELRAVQIANDAFGRGAEHFANALNIAKEEGLGDEAGLSLLTSLQSAMADLHKAMQEDKHLPDLNAMQAIANDIAKYNAHGIELSQAHLADHMAGHGVGGAQYVIKE